ncbi:MAG: MFS transporter [Phycisphaerae bacterium]|nr:MFS transporter [Phycisphaerae bacterium]MDW8261443.1 MFS transporter [Phycisphaerales bacterium]
MQSSAPLEYARGSGRPGSAMLILWLVVLSDMIGFGVIIPSLPLYAREYDASPLQVALLFSLFSACQFVAGPVMGLISDRFGRRPVLALSQVGTVAGYLLLGWTMIHQWQNTQLALLLMYLSRVIDGISGGNISAAHAYIGDISTPENRAARMGLLGAAFGIGFSAGPALGGVLSLIHHAAPAFGAAALSGVACAMTIAFLPESRKPGAHSSRNDWWHPSHFMPVLRQPVIGQLLLVGFASMLAFVMLEPYFALYLSEVFDYGYVAVNWFFALVGVIIVIVQAGLIGPLVRALGEWRLLIAGPLIAALAQGIYFYAAMRASVSAVIVATVLNAVGRSLWWPTQSSLVSQSAGPDAQGITFGVMHALMSLSRVIGPVVAGAVFIGHVTAPFLLAGAILASSAVWLASVRLRQSRPVAAQPVAATTEAAP